MGAFCDTHIYILIILLKNTTFLALHGIPNNKPLCDGDIISIDCGVLKNGFYGDKTHYLFIKDCQKIKLSRFFRLNTNENNECHHSKHSKVLQSSLV